MSNIFRFFYTKNVLEYVQFLIVDIEGHSSKGRGTKVQVQVGTMLYKKYVDQDHHCRTMRSRFFFCISNNTFLQLPTLDDHRSLILFANAIKA